MAAQSSRMSGYRLPANPSAGRTVAAIQIARVKRRDMLDGLFRQEYSRVAPAAAHRRAALDRKGQRVHLAHPAVLHAHRLQVHVEGGARADADRQDRDSGREDAFGTA